MLAFLIASGIGTFVLIMLIGYIIARVKWKLDERALNKMPAKERKIYRLNQQLEIHRRILQILRETPLTISTNKDELLIKEASLKRMITELEDKIISLGGTPKVKDEDGQSLPFGAVKRQLDAEKNLTLREAIERKRRE